MLFLFQENETNISEPFNIWKFTKARCNHYQNSMRRIINFSLYPTPKKMKGKLTILRFFGTFPWTRTPSPSFIREALSMFLCYAKFSSIIEGFEKIANKTKIVFLEIFFSSNFYLKGSHVIHKTLWQRSGNVLQHLQQTVKKHIQ